MVNLMVLLYFEPEAKEVDVDAFRSGAPGVLGAARAEGLFESVRCGSDIGAIEGGADYAFSATLPSPDAAQRWFASERHEDMSRLLRPIMRNASHIQIAM